MYLYALGADRPLRLVRGVVGQLGEDLGPTPRLLVPYERNERAADAMAGRHADLTDRREDVDVGDELIARVAAVNPAPRTISITPIPRSSRLALAVGNARP